MALHHIAAMPETTRFGIFDASFPAVLTVNSADTVTFECVSGGVEVMSDPASVAIAGATFGDMLEVRIEKIEPELDWGFCGIRPLAGWHRWL